MKRSFESAVLILYAAATLVLAVHHEPWRDEADSWLLVNNASLATIVHWTRNAGTPALWYVLLKPLAWMHLPYFSQAALHLVLAWAAAAVFVFCAPLQRWTKALFLASFYPLYEYAVIARSYVLTELLLFIAAATYEHPLAFAIAVALLFNTNVPGAIIAAVLCGGALRRAEARRYTWIMAAGALVALAQLVPPSDVFRNNNQEAPLQMIGWAFFPTSGVYWGFALGLIVFVWIAYAIRADRNALLLLVAPSAVLGFIYWRVWYGGYRHAGVILVLAVAALWIARKPAVVALNVALLFSVVVTIPIARDEIAYAFSGSKEMGTYIRDHRLDRFDIAAHKPFQCEAVLPYLPGKQFWYAALGEPGTYLKWDRALRQAGSVTYDEASVNARRHFGARPWLLLLNAKLIAPEHRGYRLIYATQRRVFWMDDEQYWLYEPIR